MSQSVDDKAEVANREGYRGGQPPCGKRGSGQPRTRNDVANRNGNKTNKLQTLHTHDTLYS